MCIFLGHNGTRTLTCFSPVVGWRGLAWHGGTHSNANLTGAFWDTIIEATVLLYYPVPTNQIDHPQTRRKKKEGHGGSPTHFHFSSVDVVPDLGEQKLKVGRHAPRTTTYERRTKSLPKIGLLLLTCRVR